MTPLTRNQKLRTTPLAQSALFMMLSSLNAPVLGSTQKTASLAKGMVFANLSLKRHYHLNDRIPSRLKIDHAPAFLAQGAVTDDSLIEVEISAIKKIFVSDRFSGSKRLQSIYISSGYRQFFLPWLGVGMGVFSTYSMGDVESLDQDEQLIESSDEIKKTDFHTQGLDLSMIFVPFPEWRLLSSTSATPTFETRFSKTIGQFSSDHISFSLGIRTWIR